MRGFALPAALVAVGLAGCCTCVPAPGTGTAVTTMPLAPVTSGAPPLTDFYGDCSRGLLAAARIELELDRDASRASVWDGYLGAAQRAQDCYWAAYKPLLAQHRTRTLADVEGRARLRELGDGIAATRAALARNLRRPESAPRAADMQRQIAQADKRLREFCTNPDVGDWLPPGFDCTRLNV